MALILLTILIILIILSLGLRVRQLRGSVAGIETKSSPVALAVQDLVATAGGVYLAIVALSSFLKLDMPDRILLMAVSVDPLALSAIALALIQPLCARLYHKIIHK